MSENEKKNNTKKSPGKSDFEDFEEAFFNEGEFQVQEAKTGNYMAEDFGTDLWEDFELPLDAPKVLPENENIGVPKVAQKDVVVEVKEEDSEEIDDAFSLDGFALEDDPIPDLQPEAMVSVEIDDFSLDDLEDFNVEEDDLFPVVEEQFDPEEQEDSEDKTVPVQIQLEQAEPPEEGFVLEDFGVATLEEQDELLDFEDSMDDVFESVVEPLEEQSNVQTMTTEVGIVVIQEGDDDFSLEEDLSLEDEIEFDDIVDAPLGVSISLDKPVAEAVQEAVEEPPPKPVVQTKRILLEGAIDILLEEAGHTKEQQLYCEAARRAYLQGGTEEALDILMRVEDTEKSKDYLHLLLQASYDCVDVRVFQKALHELLPLVSPQERAVLWTMGAKLDLLSEQDASAQEKLQHAIQEDSNNSYAQLLLWQNSKRLGLWEGYIQTTKDLARMSPPKASSILLQMAAEVALERCNDREEALKLIRNSSASQGRIYKKLMTRLGWEHHEAEQKPSALLDLYGALVNLAQSKQNLQHDMLRWVQILAAPEQSALQEQQVFAEGSEKKVIDFLLARNSAENLQGNLLQSDPSVLFGLRGDISTVGEAQQMLIHCEPEKHGSATRFLIVQDLYRTKVSSSGPAKPKLGRAWLGVRRGRMALNPTEMADIFDFPGAGVIQELWYIHLSMREELELLYIKRANSSSEPHWKAHWLYQAGLVQNNRALFEQARTVSEHIPVGYTREYISAWKDWQFGEGDFLDCIELLEKQAQVCDTVDFKTAVSLLKGEQSESFHTLRILSDAPMNSEQVSQAMNDLTEHEKGWLSLSLLFSKPEKEVFRLAFSHAPLLPTDLLFALALTAFALEDPELYALLDAQLGTSKEDQELRLALLFVSNNEARVTKNLEGMSIDELREDCSILAEICGMWNIAQEYAAHPEEVFGGMRPAETRRVLEERLAKQPSLDVALHLANMCADSLSSYQYLKEASQGTVVQYGFQAAYVDNQKEDVAADLKELFEGMSIWGSHTQQLVQSLYEQKETQALLHVAQRCPELADEIVIRLLSLSAWKEAQTLLSQTVPGLVHNLRMESIASGLERWEEYYHLLQKRMADAQSQAVREQAESKCAYVMLEHLADRDFTLTYYQAKADADPGNNDHLEALSRIAIAQGNIQKGIQALETLYEQATNSEQAAQYLFRIGEALESDGRTLPAIEKLKLALDLYPPAQEIRASLKGLLYKGQYTDNLITVLQQEIEITQGDKQREVMKELALLHEEKLQEYEKSINIWAKIWHKDENDQEALNKLIDLSNIMKDDKQAVQYMQELFSIKPSAELIMDIAHRVQSFGDKSLFEEALLKATDFEAVRMTALQKLSDYYRLHQESEKYSQAMLSIVDETDSDVEKVRILEQILTENEQSIRSQETLFQICSMIEQLEPNHTQSIRFIAEYHYQAQSYNLSIPFFERVLDTYKEEEREGFEGRMRYSDLLFRFANALRLENRKNDSIRRLRDLLKLIPYHMQALRLIGPMLIEEGALDEASQTYKSLLMNVGSESPEAFPLYLELGDIEVARGDNDQAIQFFVRAFRMEPEDIRVIHSLAQLCVKQKRWNKALQLYQKLLSTRKITKAVTMEGMLVKAWILNKNLNLHDKAYKHLEQSLQYEANQPIVLLCMAEMRYQKGEYANAIQLLERMMTLEEGPHNNLALMLKSACLQKEGRAAEGLAIQELLKITSEELDSRLKEGFSQPLY